MKQTFTSMKTTVLQEHIFHVFSGSNLCLFSSSISARKNFNLSASSMPEEMQTVRMDTDRMGSCADTSLTWASMEAVAQFWQLHLGTLINYLNKYGLCFWRWYLHWPCCSTRSTVKNRFCAWELDSSHMKWSQKQSSVSAPHIYQPLTDSQFRTTPGRAWSKSLEMHTRQISGPQQPPSHFTNVWGHTSHLAPFVAKRHITHHSGFKRFPSLYWVA